MLQLVGLLVLAFYATRVNTQSSNPYLSKSVWIPDHYASEVNAAAVLVIDATLKAKMLKVASVPTFTWLDTVAKVADLPNYLAAAGSSILQIVVYDLPNRNCHATTSALHGDFAFETNGAALYRQYIDAVVSAVKGSPGSTVVAVVEPNSLANLITNLSDPRCASYGSQYKDLIVYACKNLTSAGVYVYLDGANAGWLGWPANIAPAATLFAQVYKASGSSSFMRGLSANVGSYDALTASSPDPVTSGNSNYDTSHFINAIAPLLASAGWSATFIVDQGRSGRQNIRTTWTATCNLKGAGLGIRPTTSTGSTLIDAIVWVKPPGESDGTSDKTSPNYNAACASADSKVPSPEAGQWFQAYFFDLVNYANPAL